MNRHLHKIVLVCALTTILSVSVSAQASVVHLPDPNTYAIRIDDFYSYSTSILIALGFQGFNFKAGSGNLNLGIFTGDNSINNKNLNNGFPIPLQSPSGQQSASLSGVWGDLTGQSQQTPILVDTLLTFLHTNFGSNINIPVFVFDFSQNDNRALTIDGQVVIRNSQGVEVKQWSFDAVNDSIFEANQPITVPGTVQFPPTTGSIIGPIDSNRGSGKADFINYAPDMDLRLFAGQGDTIEFRFNLANLNGGFEELFLSGAFAADQSTVPEPGTMLLVGIGLAGTGYMRRARNRNKAQLVD